MLRYGMAILLCFCLFVGLGFAQQCYWWTFGASGNSQESMGNTVGQTAAAEFSFLEVDASYGFWFGDWDLEICFTPDASDSAEWLTRRDSTSDTLSFAQTVEMTPDEKIVVTNCGSCYIDYGLRIVGCLPANWTSAVTAGSNRYVLRAQFTDTETLTEDFMPEYDVLGTDWTWADDSIFGRMGEDIDPTNTINLWFEFTSPLISEFSGYHIIKVQLCGKLRLP